MPRPMKGQGRYMPGLDGLRAIAVLAVIAYHLNLSWAPGGLLGVGVFFVLSGYLITDLLLSEWTRTGRLSLADFWSRRARRLLPALGVMLLVVITWVTLTQPSLLQNLRGDVLAAVLYISNWWFIFHHVSYFARWGPPSPLGHLWSLAVEEQFYLVWPLLLWLGLRWVPRRGWLTLMVLLLATASALAMALLYQPGHDPSRVYYGTDTRAFSLLIGAALALVWPSRRLAGAKRAPAWLDAAGIAGLTAVLVLVAMTTETEPFLYRGGMVILSLATAVVVAALAHPGTRLSRILGARPLAWLGVRSYGIYLWHYPVIVLTTAVDNPAPDVWRAAAQVAASILLAALSWRFIEEPIRRGRLQQLLQTLRADHWRLERVPERGRLASAGAVVTLSVSLSCLGLAGLVPGSQLAMPRVTAITPAPAHHLKLSGPPVPALAAAPPPERFHPTPWAESASTPSDPPPAVRAAVPTPAGHGVTAIGDSVLIDAAPYLRMMLPGIVVDAEVGRQLYQAPAVIRALAAEGDLGHRVFIMELGTNGPFSRAQILGLLRMVKTQHILLVNTRVPRLWQAQVNATLAWTARHYPHTIMVNWLKFSAGHPGWFWPDGVHLNPTGAKAYASLVARVVKRVEGASAARPR